MITGLGSLTVGSVAVPASEVSVNGSILLQYITFTANITIFGPSSIISVTGTAQVAGTGVGKVSGSYQSGGGSYGGSGGVSVVNIAGVPYGSYWNPILRGSRGSNSATYNSTFLFFPTSFT